MATTNPTSVSATAAEMAYADLTPAYLKANYLTGLTLLGADGCELPDLFYTEHINNAVARIEMFTTLDLLERSIVGEKHDYRVQEYVNYGFIQLFRFPCRDVSEVRAVYPTGQTIQVFPTAWIRLENYHSHLHLVPTSGTLSQVIIGQGADYLPLIYSGLGYLPQVWEVDYTSGFSATRVPRMVIEAIAKWACIDMLQIVSDLIHTIGAASVSLSVDGMSQSKNLVLPAFKARIDAYKMDLFGQPQMGVPGLTKQLRDTYLGINMGTL